MKFYFAREICKTLNIPYNCLKEWLAYIPPTQKASGTGSRNIFTENDLQRLKRFKGYREIGMSRELAVKYMNGYKPE